MNFLTALAHSPCPCLGAEADQDAHSSTANSPVQQAEPLMAAWPAVTSPCPLKLLLCFLLVVFPLVVPPTITSHTNKKVLCEAYCSQVKKTREVGKLQQSLVVRTVLFADQTGMGTLTRARKTHQPLRTPQCSCGCRCSAAEELCVFYLLIASWCLCQFLQMLPCAWKRSTRAY